MVAKGFGMLLRTMGWSLRAIGLVVKAMGLVAKDHSGIWDWLLWDDRQGPWKVTKGQWFSCYGLYDWLLEAMGWLLRVSGLIAEGYETGC